MASELREVDLSASVIVERLDACTRSKGGDPRIIDDIYELVQKLIATEDLHAGRLDTRAVSLFGAVGFSMTVAFAFGGWPLLEKSTSVPCGKALAVLFSLSLAAGIVAGGFALFGLRLRKGHQIVDEDHVFHTEILAAGKKQVDFRIYLTAHLWKIWQDRKRKSDERAKAIQVGQQAFGVFLLFILALAGVITWAVLVR